MEPTKATQETRDEERSKGKPPRFQSKVYSQQLVEYANQNLRPDELNIYKALFNEIKDNNKIEDAEHLMMLDLVVYDFIRVKRIQKLIMKEGDVVSIKLRSGQTISKAHEASYLLNAIETQIRGNMKELMLTRKEVIKKQIGLGQKDFASLLAENTIDADYRVEGDKDGNKK